MTATFADGSSESAAITAYGRNTGAIYGTLFELVETGTSYSNPFALYNASDSALVSLAIDLAPASSVFDLDYGGEIGTEGSNLGRTAVEASSSGSEDGTSLTGVVEATYSGLVNVAGSDPVGDLYTSLLIDLSGTTDGGLASGSDWYFIADTDQLATEGDLAPVAPVPLPAGLLPLAAALSGLALLHRRKARGTAL
ncbi:hypothetical protein [Poseidonocella sp. HB161398]|uniref:hypothetical protein n=1 Tax=Poseidonocella sp. HB161398 TaxID=2320855 RepID=UPI0011090276|nr:hypothetical protein [Poseidonocella sp. HB161398]